MVVVGRAVGWTEIGMPNTSGSGRAAHGEKRTFRQADGGDDRLAAGVREDGLRGEARLLLCDNRLHLLRRKAEGGLDDVAQAGRRQACEERVEVLSGCPIVAGAVFGHMAAVPTEGTGDVPVAQMRLVLVVAVTPTGPAVPTRGTVGLRMTRSSTSVAPFVRARFGGVPVSSTGPADGR